MRGAFKIARLFGIDLKIHWSFFIIILYALMQGGSTTQKAAIVVAILLLFVCVTLHEFGHSLVALRFGIPVREIVLLPIGGVAFLSRMPDKPRQEFLIAIAGPLVNVAILAVLIPIGFALGAVESLPHLKHIVFNTPMEFHSVNSLVAVLVLFLISVNAMLILFNMIPAFPLDGGRIFRSLLAMRMPYVKATRIAATVGQIAAVIIAVYALSGQEKQLGLLVIAFFIFIGAGAESTAAQTGTVLATRRVGDAYNKTAITLTMDHRVSHVIEHLFTSYQPDFAVVHRGQLAGVVTRGDVLKWLAEAPSLYDVYVTEVMRDAQKVLRVPAAMTLDEVSKAMADAETGLAAVYDADHYLGLVSTEDIAEAQAVLTFLNRRLAEGTPPTRTAWPVPLHEAPRT